MKRKFSLAALVLALCFVLSGSAWADAQDVRDAIDGYGLTHDGGSGNTITVTGTVTKLADQPLDLGDITGLVIDWKANLTVDGGYTQNGVIRFNGNGDFKLTGGTIEIVSAEGWADAIRATGGAPTVTIDGGTIRGRIWNSTGINISEIHEDSEAQGTLIIKSGTLDFPKGDAAMTKTLQVSGTATINGIIYEEPGDRKNPKSYLYGTVTTPPIFYELHDGYIPSDSLSYIVKSGATWNIEGVIPEEDADAPKAQNVIMEIESGGTINLKNTGLTFKGKFDVAQTGTLNVGVAQGDTSILTLEGGTVTNDGTINIYGTLTNLDKVINNGTINNYSGNTLDNRGTLTNNGTISNKSTGVITNSGTIDNASGKINNEGKITNSGTIKSDAADYIGNEPEGKSIEPISDSKTSSDSGGGCNAGFGVLGLLIAGLVARKGRLIRLNSPK
jgi:hypothetical protein